MGFYPVFLELAGRHGLVVGGGLVADRRGHGLLAADARLTGGAPALAPAIREELERYLTAEYATLAEIAAEARRELRAAGRVADAETWRRALQVPEVRRVIVERGREEAKRRLLERLGAPACA